MIRAFFLSLGDLLVPRVAAVFLKSLALTVVFALLFGVGLWLGLRWGIGAVAAWAQATLDAGQAAGWGWLLQGFAALGQGTTAADLLTIVIFFFLAWLLFRAIAIAVIGIFADEVVESVEKRHYPAAHAKVRHIPNSRAIAMGLRSGARALFYNVLCLPVFVVAHVFAPIVFFVLNAWLLGRDLGDMVAVRHMPESKLRTWRKRNFIRRFLLGSLGTALLLVPGINLLAPIFGAAMAAHMFHGGRR